MLVSQGPLSMLCGGDAMRLIDCNSHAYMGFVVLGDFVPYDRNR